MSATSAGWSGSPTWCSAPSAPAGRSRSGDGRGGAVPEGGGDVVEVHQAFGRLGRERQRLAGGVADALPGGDGVAGERLDQEGERQAARHVGVEVRIGDADRGEATRRGGLGGGHDRCCHRSDLDADVARQVEPVRLGREVEGEHAKPHNLC
jgi:hypothetical protein